MMRKLLALVIILVMSLPAAAQPGLWRVKDADTEVHIFGTIHVLKPGTIWLQPEMRAILNELDALYLEVDPSQLQPEKLQTLVVALGRYADGTTLKQQLSAETYAKIEAEFQGLQFPEPAYASMKPWLAAITYGALQFVRLGYNQAAGVEATLTGYVSASGVPIYGFETAEYQLNALATLPETSQIAMLKDMLSHKDDLPGYMETLTTAWLEGDLDTLDEVIQSGLKEDAAMAEALLFRRNKNWVGEMDKLMEKPGHYMVAVGSGHLVGGQSFLGLLAEKGYEVERIH